MKTALLGLDVNALLLGLGLLAATPALAAADGWVDCNGPDKQGHGCDASGTDGATTAVGLATVSLVAFRVSRKRKG